MLGYDRLPLSTSAATGQEEGGPTHVQKGGQDAEMKISICISEHQWLCPRPRYASHTETRRLRLTPGSRPD